MTRRALITGITGQDGSYLAELLLSKGYEVHGIIRRTSSFNTSRIDHIYEDPHAPNARLFLHYGDLLDAHSLGQAVTASQPHEVYNLGAQSHVRVSFDLPNYTMDTVAQGTQRLLQAVQQFRHDSGIDTRFYQAGSSEMFGASPAPQGIETPFQPQSPYAIAKAAAHAFVCNERERSNLFAVNGILFNHESERRGETFVTRKITRAVGRIAQGQQKHLHLGNLAARRDWGYAPDFVEAMWMMMQQDEPHDTVVGTGTDRSVEQFLDAAFGCAGLDWHDFVKYDARYARPVEVERLSAECSQLEALGWKPTTLFDDWVQRMVDHDTQLARREGGQPESP